MPTFSPAKDPLSAARKGFKFLKALQAPDGHWVGEYGGPMFLIPGLVIGSYVADMPFEEEEKTELIRYLLNLAHPEDGGWGLSVSPVKTCSPYLTQIRCLDILKGPRQPLVLLSTILPLDYLAQARTILSWRRLDIHCMR